MLITADLHLTDRPIDEYRWAVFPWLRKQAKAKDARHCFILGDLTQHKDNHPAKLVNRLVDELQRLSGLCKVWILKGNHDFADPQHPFFGFLAKMKDVEFVDQAVCTTEIYDFSVVLLPYTDDYERDWGNVDFDVLDYVFMHQAVQGARSESGHVMEGVPRSVFASTRARFISGDIHVPQKVGNVIYVGAPHPIRFGDDFQPRVLYVDPDAQLKSLKRATLQKLVVTVTSSADLEQSNGAAAGDMVKVVAKLPRSEFAKWNEWQREIREWADNTGAKLCGIELRERAKRAQLGEEPEPESRLQVSSPIDVVRRYCQSQMYGDQLTEAAIGFLKANE